VSTIIVFHSHTSPSHMLPPTFSSIDGAKMVPPHLRMLLHHQNHCVDYELFHMCVLTGLHGGKRV
jgi:hypothetical protein